jgi:hypothetical protein
VRFAYCHTLVLVLVPMKKIVKSVKTLTMTSNVSITHNVGGRCYHKRVGREGKNAESDWLCLHL